MEGTERSGHTSASNRGGHRAVSLITGLIFGLSIFLLSFMCREWFPAICGLLLMAVMGRIPIRIFSQC